MKYILGALLFFFIINARAQNDSIVKIELRNLQMQELSELNVFAHNIYEVADSALLTNDKKWKLRLDSLAADSAMTLAGVGFIAELEQIFLTGLKAPNSFNQSSLVKLVDSAKDLDTQTQYFQKLHEWIYGKFVTLGSWEQALICTRRLNDAKTNLLNSKVEMVEALADSLNESLEFQKSVLKKTEQDALQKQQLWMAVAGVALFMFLLTVVMYLITKSKMRKRMKEEIEKAGDRSELEAVVKKLNDTRQERDQLKSGVKSSDEKVAVLEESRRKLIQNLKQLADEINGGLDEVKSQGESNKSGMNPAAYMAIQNAVTRMGNTIAQRFQALSDSLK